MKKAFILTIIAILSFMLGINAGNSLILYIFDEETSDSGIYADTENNEDLNNSDDSNTEQTENTIRPETDTSNASNEYIFAKSSSELLKDTDVKGLSKEEIEKGKNEIFARYGHDFSSQTLKNYFSDKKWYTPISGKKVSVSELNDIEQENVVFLDKILKS